MPRHLALFLLFASLALLPAPLARAQPVRSADGPAPAPDAPALDHPPPHVPAGASAEAPTDPASAAPGQEPTVSPSAAPSGAAGQEPTVSFNAAPGQGVTFDAGDRFSLNLKNRIQIRYQLTNSPGASEPQQSVSIATLRIGLSGHLLTRRLTYGIQLALAARDYRDGSTSPVYDAFLDWKAHRDVGLKVGQYFVPFDRLRTIREFALQMAERPRPVPELSLDRDVGITLYSDTFLAEHSPVAYRVGVFGGGGINLTSTHSPGALFVGRLEFRPLGPVDDDSEGDLERREKPGLALGIAGAANLNTNRVKSTTGDTLLGGTTNYYHAAVDAMFKWRGLGLELEYLYRRASIDDIVSQDAQGNELSQATRSGQGWVVQASYLFEPPIEIVGRLSGLYAFDGTDPKFIIETTNFGQEVGAGVNYYINKHRFKLQADWIARMPHDFDMSAAENSFLAIVDVTF